MRLIIQQIRYLKRKAYTLLQNENNYYYQVNSLFFFNNQKSQTANNMCTCKIHNFHEKIEPNERGYNKQFRDIPIK